MELNEKFSQNQYCNLTLVEVYQGTSNINKTLLKNFMVQCLDSQQVPKITENVFIEKIVVREDEITIFPDNTFDENKPPGRDNLYHIGDISLNLSSYFNNFFKKNWYGIIESFEKFNQRNGQHVIGGDPEYLEFCLNKKYIHLDSAVKSELENLKVNRLKGIKCTEIESNKYSYAPIIEVEYFKFKAV